MPIPGTATPANEDHGVTITDVSQIVDTAVSAKQLADHPVVQCFVDIPLEIEWGQPDPYVTPCPAWCEAQHSIESNDADRYHYGEQVMIPIRGIRARMSQSTGAPTVTRWVTSS